MKEAEATGFKTRSFRFFCILFLSKMNFKNVFFYIEGMSIMFYDLLVVYPMKSSVNKFYNVMSLYCIQHEFLYKLD